MVSHRHRRKVVIDTNVFVGTFRSLRLDSFNRQVIHQWLVQKQLQLVVSREVIVEYLGIFESVLGFPPERLAAWNQRFHYGERITLVELGPRVFGSRDVDDNLFLSVAQAGQAETLVTNDRDLLELPTDVRKRLRFSIVSPREFLAGSF
jgi:putative PIN family toxin of toxin-antitoxin system